MPPVLDQLNLADLLFEQQTLTAVDRFSQRHQNQTFPAQARYYRDLIPLAAPRPEAGEQYAFEVDLDQCSGCKACVTACHTLNGLEEDESWRSVGLLHGGTAALPFQQTVTTACHHCLDPGCLHGCPVLAYDKDPRTGIVRHLDDQCIGCQYCVWKCPYEVPHYSKRLGIVRKCDLCYHRLSAHEAPACVQACPNQAIRIRVVQTQHVLSQITATSTLVPGAPPSHLTLPTTEYKTSRTRPDNVASATPPQRRPEPAHWPLVFMLVLTQMGIGLEAAGLVLRLAAPALLETLGPVLASAALGSVLGGIILGTAHLGQPLRAWRAFLGFRTSWLSREMILFAAFIPVLALHALAEGWPGRLSSWLGAEASALVVTWLHLAAVGVGGLALFTSIMIYHDTGRAFWHARLGAVKFALTSALLGLAGLWLLAVAPWTPGPGPSGLQLGLAGGVMVLSLAKLAWEGLSAGQGRWSSGLRRVLGGRLRLGLSLSLRLRKRSVRHGEGWETSTKLLHGPLKNVWRGRFVFGLLGGVLLPAGFVGSLGLMPHAPSWVMSIPLYSVALLAAGELAERYLFFTAVTMPRMPGGGA